MRGYHIGVNWGDYVLSVTGSAKTAMVLVIAPTVTVDAVAAGDGGTTAVLGATLTGRIYDGEPEYAWEVDGGRLDDATSATPTWTRPSVNADTRHKVSLTVTVMGDGTNALDATSAEAKAESSPLLRDTAP